MIDGLRAWVLTNQRRKISTRYCTVGDRREEGFAGVFLGDVQCLFGFMFDDCSNSLVFSWLPARPSPASHALNGGKVHFISVPPLIWSG